ncbi:undecaprenyl-diphosphatase [Candidatus Marinamargulisbacteria bacterium SCGC AG-410-N11]|nr:undecaprenyl-diphosphatase [Candidatus Marinamargulisbacteria bacterium SCGC AG-410-N11]
MPDLLKAIILGIIEGITEFLPVSSTGHLILASEWLNFKNSETFNISIQLGAILAVVIHYFSFFYKLAHPKNWLSKEMKLIFIAILPATTLGLLVHDFIKTHLFESTTVIIALFLGGIVMIYVDSVYKPKESTKCISNMTYKQSLFIGLFQCFALWPGMSRSGSTIVGGIFSKLDYSTAAKFSFIIAVPIMFGAVSLDIFKALKSGSLSSHDLQLIGIGMLVSFIVGYLSIVTFLSLLKRWKLFPFGCYRIVLSVIFAYIIFL